MTTVMTDEERAFHQLSAGLIQLGYEVASDVGEVYFLDTLEAYEFQHHVVVSEADVARLQPIFENEFKSA